MLSENYTRLSAKDLPSKPSIANVLNVALDDPRVPVAVLLDLPQLQLVFIDPLFGDLGLRALRRFRTLPFPQTAPYGRHLWINDSQV